MIDRFPGLSRGGNANFLNCSDLTPSNCFALTGAEWTTKLILPKETAALHYTTPVESEAELQSFLIPLYQSYLKSSPRLRISKSATGYSLYADEPLKKGTVVTEYLGEWSTNSKGSPYRFGSIDALKFRNYAAFAEDGFPNLEAFYLYGVDNAPLRILFVALEDVAPGTLLTINYGLNHSIKTIERIEYGLEAMRDFFTQNPLQELVQKIRWAMPQNRIDLGWEEVLAFENRVAKLQYLFHTPSAFSALFSEGILDPKPFFNFFAKLDNRYQLLSYKIPPTPRQREVEERFAALQRR